MAGITLATAYSDVKHPAQPVFHPPQTLPPVSHPAPWGDAYVLPDEAITGNGAFVKRALDIVVASAALFVLAIFLLAVAIAIKADSRGPVFFRQRRTGLGGSPIEVWKFRTMHVSSCDHGGAQQTTRDDCRVTAVGRFLRKRSIDELPQILNVLNGSMSLVGPRPHALQTTVNGVPLWDSFPSYRLRYRVKPGITGLAQISGYRGELDAAPKLRGRVRLDLLYIARWSPLLDVKIIVLTGLKVLFDRRAY